MLSFFLAFALFLLSCCAVLYFTVFSKDHIINIMRTSGYYDMVSSELQSRMEDLVDASGFDKQFADDFVKNCNVQKAVEEYVSSFYSGYSTLVDTTAFRQELYAAVDAYITDKSITVNEDTDKYIAYFINEAAQIYVDQISIPFFSAIANYISKARDRLNAAAITTGVFALIIAAVILFSNRYRHRRYKYLFISSAGAALALTVLPSAVLLSGVIGKINLTTRSIYNLFVNYFNTLFYSFYIWAGISAAFSVIMLALYVRHYRRALGL